MAWGLNKKAKFKDCNGSQYCLSGICINKRPEGSACLTNKECKKDLLCVFGVCNKADEGDAGTQCKKHDQCDEDLCCFGTRMAGTKECTSRLPLGAVCMNSPFPSFGSTLSFPFRKKRSTKKCDNPCEDDLKCAPSGMGMEMRCVPKDFKFNPIDELGEGSGEKETDKDKKSKGDEKIKVETDEGVEIPGSTTNKDGKKGAKKDVKKTKKQTKVNQNSNKKENTKNAAN